MGDELAVDGEQRTARGCDGSPCVEVIGLLSLDKIRLEESLDTVLACTSRLDHTERGWTVFERRGRLERDSDMPYY